MAVPSLVQEISSTFNSTSVVLEVPAVSSGSVLLVTISQTASQAAFGWGVPTEGWGYFSSSSRGWIRRLSHDRLLLWQDIVGRSTNPITVTSTFAQIQSGVHGLKIGGADPNNLRKPSGSKWTPAKNHTNSGLFGF